MCRGYVHPLSLTTAHLPGKGVREQRGNAGDKRRPAAAGVRTTASAADPPGSTLCALWCRALVIPASGAVVEIVGDGLGGVTQAGAGGPGGRQRRQLIGDLPSLALQHGLHVEHALQRSGGPAGQGRGDRAGVGRQVLEEDGRRRRQPVLDRVEQRRPVHQAGIASGLATANSAAWCQASRNGSTSSRTDTTRAASFFTLAVTSSLRTNW